MKNFPNLVHLFLILFIIKFVSLSSDSSSEEEGDDKFLSNLKENSSDDEDSVQGDMDDGVTEAFGGLNIDSERPIDFRKSNDSQLQMTSSNGAKPLSCIDGDGREVDWWFAYKEPSGKRYLYLSSLDVERSSDLKRPANFRPLDPRYVIDDPNTSPVLKTIYQSARVANSNDVWFGWNDDSHDKTDAYGSSYSSLKNAHSKGFYAQNAIPIQNQKVIIGSYAILSSLPRFPVIATAQSSSYGSALKSSLPNPQHNIFGSNLSDNAQHFMCLSFPKETFNLEVFDGIQEIAVPPLDRYRLPVHIDFLTKYLKTIYPTIVGTNFCDWNSNHWPWRRYFSLLNYPAPNVQHLFQGNPLNSNQLLLAYSTPDLPSTVGYYNPNPRIFPLTSSPFYFDSKASKMEYSDSTLYSRWNDKFAHQNGCIDGTQPACLQSFEFQTTSLQSPLSGVFFAKHCMAILDLFDDWATLQVAESQTNFDNTYSGQTVDRYGLLVQSWIDSKTILPRNPEKKIYDRDGTLIAKMLVDNVSHFDMPVSLINYPLRVHTSHKDHSKWALSFTMESFNGDLPLEANEASFNPLFFLSDLNRATTQACLKDKRHGRGGGIVAISSLSLWHSMMNLKPRSGKQRFVTTGKTRTRQMQNRLRSHTKDTFTGLSDLPLAPFRKCAFRSLRLSRKEAQKPVKVVNFVSVLSEINQFIKQAEFKEEHLAILAFKNLFNSFSEGNVAGAAKSVWAQVSNFVSKRRSPYLINWNQIFSLPSLQVYRTVQESREDDDGLRENELLFWDNRLIIHEETGVVYAADCSESFSTQIGRRMAYLEQKAKEREITKSEIEHTEHSDSEQSDAEQSDSEQSDTERGDSSDRSSDSENSDSEHSDSEKSGSERNGSDNSDSDRSDEDGGTEYYDHFRRSYYDDNDGSEDYESS